MTDIKKTDWENHTGILAEFDDTDRGKVILSESPWGELDRDQPN